jgi:DNA anti-recombination protein RmuC
VTLQKLAIQFVIHNWKGILIALLSLVVMGKMRYDYKQMQSAYEVSEQSLQAQLAGLQEIHKKQMADMEESLQVYKNTLDQVERDYQESQDELLEVIESRREEFGRQFSEDPEELSETIMLMYGFDYVP